MAAMTASRFSGATCAVLLMTRDTVEMDTLANRETSLIVATINSFVGEPVCVERAIITNLPDQEMAPDHLAGFLL